jgi:hypothetical protein
MGARIPSRRFRRARRRPGRLTLLAATALATTAGLGWLVHRRLNGIGRDEGIALDTYLPEFDVVERADLVVDGIEPDAAYDVVRNFDLLDVPLTRLLFTLRGLPAATIRVLRRLPPMPRPTGSLIDQALAMGWRILEERPGEEIVLGAVTQPWHAAVSFRGMPARRFLAFRQPGYAKIAWNLRVDRTADGRTRVSTETRVRTTDARSRVRFRRYWTVFAPFIHLIRVQGLARLRTRLLADAAPTGSAAAARGAVVLPR